MSGREIAAYNCGRDNWETVIRYGTDAALRIITAGPTTPGSILDALDNLGETVFKRWMFRGAQAAALGAES